MAQGVMVWNVTPATQQSARDVILFGKRIRPGRSALLDADRVYRYPRALQAAIDGKSVHMGEQLPSWYTQMLEEKKMKKLTNKGQYTTIISSLKFDPTRMDPGESFEVTDEQAESLDLSKVPWIVQEDVAEETLSPAEDPKTEELEPPKKAPAPPKAAKAPKKKAAAKKKPAAKKSK